jgi:hypothetical protein
MAPFKEHFIVDLGRPTDELVSPKIRYRVRKALRNMDVEACVDPTIFLDDWRSLYERAVGRFRMRSVRAFSPEAFAKMLTVPGLIAYRASARGETIGMALVFVQSDVAFGHLIGISQMGYQMDASYALYAYQIDHLSGQCRWLDLGGVPGAGSEADGLRRYKAHWATTTRMSYLCGRILDRTAYQQILGQQKVASCSYFPQYRAGEFTR